MDYLTDYIKPELLILIPVLYLIGMGLKKSQSVADRKIPLILGACGVLLAAVYVLAAAPISSWQSGMEKPIFPRWKGLDIPGFRR